MKILVATDGSKPALHAARYAVKLMRQLASTSNLITLISVQDDTALDHAKVLLGRDAVVDYLRERAEKELKPTRRLLDAAGVPHDMELRTGHVPQEILACAKAGKYDLIVLGAKGRGAISDLLLGSVAQRILATSDIPVLLVK